MKDLIVGAIFLFIVYILLGFFINFLVIDDRFQSDVMLGCLLFWPIITILIAIADLRYIIRELFNRR